MNSALAISNPNSGLCALLYKNRTITIIGPNAKEIPIAFTRGGSHEFVSHAVAEAEGIEHILPIRAAEDKRFAIFGLPSIDRAVRVPPRVEVHVLDPANIVDSIDPDPAAQRLSTDVSDVVAFVAAGVDALIGIEQFQIESRGILAPHGNGPWIGDGRSIDNLLGIIDRQATDGAVGIQGEERVAVFASRPAVTSNAVPTSPGLGCPRSLIPLCDGTQVKEPRSVTPSGTVSVPRNKYRPGGA